MAETTRDPLEVLPCPFCGNRWHKMDAGFHGRFVMCMGCKAMTRQFTDDEAAIAAWNVRAVPSPALGVKVKPLVWEKQDDHYSAKGAARTYIVQEFALEPGVWVWIGAPVGAAFKTPELAMASAESDQDARIRAALDPDTSTALGAAAVEWRPMPAPNDIDLLVLRSTGVIEYISADDNDYTWGNTDHYAASVKAGIDSPVSWTPAAAIRSIPAPTPAQLLAEAARVLLSHSESVGAMPDAARLAGVQAYIDRDQRCRPAALSDAWFAALRAIAAPPKGDGKGGDG